MTLRIARHTANLQKTEVFYTKVIGLQKLGSFQNHSGYDGIFLEYPQQDWHLEYTCSNDAPDNHFDEDDLLVFYINSAIEMAEIKNIISK